MARTVLRSLVCLVIAAGVLGARIGHTSDIAFFVGDWAELWYDERQFKDVDTIVEKTAGMFISTSRFDDETLDDFEKWVRPNLRDGELDIIWLNGSMPPFLYPDDTLATEWLDTGNMFINVSHPFGYQYFGCGGPCDENGAGGPAAILDLAPEIFTNLPAEIKIGSNTAFSRTPAGEQYMPSMPARTVTSHVITITEVKGDWSVVAVFSSNTGGEDDADYAEPGVIYNKKTHGYLAVISQAGFGLWNNRGKLTSDFITNWVPANAIGFSVQPEGKLVTTWSAIKKLVVDGAHRTTSRRFAALP